MGFGLSFRCCLKCVKDKKPLTEVNTPSAPTIVMGTPKMMDVTTTANIRRTQFKTA